MKQITRFKRLLSGVLSAVMAVSVVPIVSAHAEESTEPYPYTMFAASNDEGAITVNAGNFCVNGNIATNGTIVSSGNMNINGTRTEHANESMLYVLKKLNYSYFSGENVETYTEDYVLEDLNININNPISVDGTIELTGNINLNSGIKAADDVTINGEVKNSNNAVICSEAGDINIETSNVSFNGLIYAPYGDIVIDSDNLNLNNAVIIGQTVTIDCPNVNANYSSNMAELIGNESDIDVQLYAMGKYDEESNAVNISWFTNYNNSVYEIQYSVDNESYNKIAEVTGSKEYSYVLSNDFDKGYFRVGLTTNYGENIFSIPFVVKNTNGNISVELIDSDDDKLPDVFELMYETDVLNPDTDLDGLTDYEEVYITLTSPKKYDSIYESISDSEVDMDGDDLSNIQEINLGTSPRLKDTDNDDLWDNDEILLYNTDPLIPDTDEDGISDGNEIAMGLDPNDPETFDMPDAEYSVNQTITSESAAFSKINSEDNPYKASLDVKIADVASKSVVIKESPYAEILSNNQSIVGKVISISYNKPADSSVLKLQIKQEFINNEINENEAETGLSGINKYHIFCYDENGILHPVETHISDNELSTDATIAGDYCIINLNKWLSSLDTVLNEEQLNNGTDSNIDVESLSPIDTSNQIQALSYPKSAKLLSASPSSSTSSNNAKRHEVDLVYVIDTSGSMSNTINTAKSSMYNLVSFLHDDGIDVNIGVISYSDYIYDGVNGAKTYTINGSHWATTPSDASQLIDQVRLYGNGHETPLDGLEMAHRLDFHEKNTKFMVLITDEPYIYSDNRYGIISMQDLADDLKKDKIYTSVVCYNSDSNGYSPIYDTTQGIQIDLSLNWPLFLEQYIRTFIKDMSTYTTVIPNSLSVISLKEVPKYGAQVNSDSDNLWDYEEIDWDYIIANESELILPTLKQYLISKYGKNSLETLPLAKEKIDRINALVILPIKSDPTKADSDGDGLNDDKDSLPFHAFDNRFKIVSNIDSVPENDFVERHLDRGQRCYDNRIEEWNMNLLYAKYCIYALGGYITPIQAKMVKKQIEDYSWAISPKYAYFLDYYLADIGGTLNLSNNEMYSIIFGQKSNTEHYAYNINQMMRVAEEVVSTDNTSQNKLYISSTDRNDFKCACYKGHNCDAHGWSYDDAIAAGWGYATGEAMCEMQAEVYKSGNKYCMKTKYYLIDTYEFPVHWDESDAKDDANVEAHHLHEWGLAQEYKIVGVYEDFITWEKDELFMPNYYRNIVVDTTEYDKDPIS